MTRARSSARRIPKALTGYELFQTRRALQIAEEIEARRWREAPDTRREPFLPHPENAAREMR